MCQYTPSRAYHHTKCSGWLDDAITLLLSLWTCVNEAIRAWARTAFLVNDSSVMIVPGFRPCVFVCAPSQRVWQRSISQPGWAVIWKLGGKKPVLHLSDECFGGKASLFHRRWQTTLTDLCHGRRANESVILGSMSLVHTDGNEMLILRLIGNSFPYFNKI